MRNRSLELSFHRYPEYLSYCIGLDSTYLRTALEDGSNGNKMLKQAADLAEQHLKRENCVGIKLYPGYHPVAVTNACYDPFMIWQRPIKSQWLSTQERRRTKGYFKVQPSLNDR